MLHVMGHRRVFVSEPNEGRKKTVDDLGECEIQVFSAALED